MPHQAHYASPPMTTSLLTAACDVVHHTGRGLIPTIGSWIWTVRMPRTSSGWTRCGGAAAGERRAVTRRALHDSGRWPVEVFSALEREGVRPTVGCWRCVVREFVGVHRDAKSGMVRHTRVRSSFVKAS